MSASSGLTVPLQAIQQSTGMLGNAVDFDKFEKRLGEQQQIIILQQNYAAEVAAHNSRLQLSVFQQRGEMHWNEEILQWTGNNARKLRGVVNEKSK